VRARFEPRKEQQNSDQRQSNQNRSKSGKRHEVLLRVAHPALHGRCAYSDLRMKLQM
jgi:hypothetical protein